MASGTGASAGIGIGKVVILKEEALVIISGMTIS